MKKIIKILTAAVMIVATLFAFTACKGSKTVEATIKLTDGRKIVLVLYPKYAPETVENFVALAKEGYYDGLCISDVQSSLFVAGDYKVATQSGDSYTVEKSEARPTIKGEFYNNGYIVQNEPLSHVAGAISMMRDPDLFDSASTAFFLCGAALPSYDRYYAVFGYAKDEESLKVIKEILAVETTFYNVDDDTRIALPSEAIIIETITIG